MCVCCVCVCVCVCVSGSIFHTVTNRPRRPTNCLSATKHSIKMFFRKTASSQSYRIHVEAIIAQLSAILFALARTRAYLNHATLLSNPWCCSCQLCIVFVHRYIAHTHILIAGCRSQPHGVICLKEGMPSVQCSLCQKISPQCSAVVSVRKLCCDHMATSKNSTVYHNVIIAESAQLS